MATEGDRSPGASCNKQTSSVSKQKTPVPAFKVGRLITWPQPGLRLLRAVDLPSRSSALRERPSKWSQGLCCGTNPGHPRARGRGSHGWRWRATNAGRRGTKKCSKTKEICKFFRVFFFKWEKVSSRYLIEKLRVAIDLFTEIAKENRRPFDPKRKSDICIADVEKERDEVEKRNAMNKKMLSATSKIKNNNVTWKDSKVSWTKW